MRTVQPCPFFCCALSCLRLLSRRSPPATALTSAALTSAAPRCCLTTRRAARVSPSWPRKSSPPRRPRCPDTDTTQTCAYRLPTPTRQ
eukprot:5228528-Prymnesium_polylepis.2